MAEIAGFLTIFVSELLLNRFRSSYTNFASGKVIVYNIINKIIIFSYKNQKKVKIYLKNYSLENLFKGRYKLIWPTKINNLKSLKKSLAVRENCF